MKCYLVKSKSNCFIWTIQKNVLSNKAKQRGAFNIGSVEKNNNKNQPMTS